MSTEIPKVQIIVEADEPALFFTSRLTAEKYLEATDVRNGVYKRCFGPNGEKFKISLDGEKVSIQPSADKELHLKDLREIIFKYLDAIQEPYERNISHVELLKRCEKHITK